MNDLQHFDDTLLLTDIIVFGDNEEHEYNVFCYDGFAVGIPTSDELLTNGNVPAVIKVTYPKLDEVSDGEKRKCLNYRGCYDIDIAECNYADLCIYFGKIADMTSVFA